MARTVGLLVCAIGIAENVFAAWPLQERIDALAANGGGTLTLTAGVYRTGALFFKPGVNLHLEMVRRFSVWTRPKAIRCASRR